MKRQTWLIGFCVVLSCIATSQPSFAQRAAATPADSNYHFAPGVRLLTGDKPIDVTTGHASPYIYDFDGDGSRDLLVGEFGSGLYRGETTSDNSPLANARLRIYLNKGTNAAPRYDGFKYLQAGGENASVPST
ncbi:MAG: hypothetical protein VB862_05155 [Pirellulaceae bacterium]